MTPSKSSLVLENRVQGGSADLCGSGDLRLACASLVRSLGELGDVGHGSFGFALGECAPFAFGGELGEVDVSSGHGSSVNHLTNQDKGRKVVYMPYVITTTERVYLGYKYGETTKETRRRAVATLAAARFAAEVAMVDHQRDTGVKPDPRQHVYAARTLPESGGKIGPLPDGTVIEVEPVTFKALAELTGHSAGDPIAAYNARRSA